MFSFRYCKRLYYGKIPRHVVKLHQRRCQTKSRVVFSGIQPTGSPHLGNYFGAIQPWLALQDSEARSIFSIVDLHSFTLLQDSTLTRQNVNIMVACLLACGIDPTKVVLFQAKGNEYQNVPLGLFTYPVLQAADILLYKATEVPVGEDQLMHIFEARKLAQMFNDKFGETFPLPEAKVSKVPRLKSLRDPTKKMSKSDVNYRSRIELTDTPEVIRDKVKKAKTDMTSSITFEPKERPEVSSLVSLYSIMTSLSVGEVVAKCSDMDTVAFKASLADVIIDQVEPIRAKTEVVLQSESMIKDVLEYGRCKAQEIADVNFQEIRERVGFL